ncbi:MAG TPA: polysaccharide deacetylase family protein [Methylomirabilota bacterium]|nr:polysaccharide deacetylase family protein [Methylomirabilota bacterium]
MLHPALSRFHFTLMAALVLTAVAWVFSSVALLCATVAAFATALGLGVALPQMRFFGPFVCRGSGSQQRVALTFDDGPDARSTPALLDVLRDARASAAFFCIGQRVAENSDLAARIVREGHLLENHSYAHSNVTNFFTLPRLKRELRQAQAAIQAAAGTSPRCYRPPIGLSNPHTFRAARALGLTVVGWTAGGLDTVLKDPERIVARILKRVRPGAIILLHDGNVPADRVVTTVKLLLDSLRKLDYEVVRLDQMLK